MGNLDMYKLLDMFFSYNNDTQNYFLVRYYEYGNGNTKKQFEVYSEYRKLDYLINDFNYYMREEFINKSDYYKKSLFFSTVIENKEKNLKEVNELDILRGAYNDLKAVGIEYVVINLELIKTSDNDKFLNELSQLYLAHDKETLKNTIALDKVLWHNESVEKLEERLKEI